MTKKQEKTKRKEDKRVYMGCALFFVGAVPLLNEIYTKSVSPTSESILISVFIALVLTCCILYLAVSKMKAGK